MSEWKECKLGDHVLINSRNVDNNYPYAEIKYLDTGSITRGKIESLQHFQLADAPSRAKRIVKDNDIVLSMVRPIHRHYGYLQNMKPNTVASTGFVVLTSKDSIDPYFLYSFLTQDEVTEYLDVVAEGSTSAYPAFTPDVVENLTINLPSLPEQRAIAAVLSSLDDKIDLLHRQNKTLEGMAEALWRKMFVEEADPGWDEKGLDEIATFLNGLPCQKYPPDISTESLPVIKIKELRTGITDDSDLATAKVPPEYIIDDGDILFSWSGSLEVVIWSFGKGVLNQHLFKVTSDDYPKWFCYYWIKHHLAEFRDIAQDKATTMGHIQRHHLSAAKVLVPDKKSFEYLDLQITPVFEKMTHNLKAIRKFAHLRDTLLPKLMSGEVRVQV